MKLHPILAVKVITFKSIQLYWYVGVELKIFQVLDITQLEAHWIRPVLQTENNADQNMEPKKVNNYAKKKKSRKEKNPT
jgi:hypothetical protein